MALLNTMQRTRLLAGTIAMMGCMLSIGGSLLLAEHYAQAGANGGSSGYHAALQVRRCECPEVRAARTTAASTLCGVANS
jgi:hypothetical protein